MPFAEDALNRARTAVQAVSVVVLAVRTDEPARPASVVNGLETGFLTGKLSQEVWKSQVDVSHVLTIFGRVCSIFYSYPASKKFKRW